MSRAKSSAFLFIHGLFWQFESIFIGIILEQRFIYGVQSLSDSGIIVNFPLLSYNETMKLSPKILGIIQAAGITIYVSAFAIFAQNIQHWLLRHHAQEHPVFTIILFLLVFIISAIICGSIIFTKPILLFFDGKKMEALRTVFWSLAWLIGFLIIFGIVDVLFVFNRF